MEAFKVGIENGDENRAVAWVLDLPGCFAYGPDPASALAATPTAMRLYADWVKAHGGQPPFNVEDFKVRLQETWQVYCVNEGFEEVPDGYAVNAWFRSDWRPLSQAELERGAQLLSWSRHDLLDCIKDISEEDLNRSYPGERWSISGILRHVAGAEWWYLDRLGLAFPKEELAKDTAERLEQVRTLLNETLPGVAGSTQVIGIDGEFWSPRKLLRRAIWHERDHTGHIRKLLAPDSSGRREL